MNRAVVELHALPYADRSASEYDDRLVLWRRRFVLLAIGGVIIRAYRLKFRRAGIDGLVGGHDIKSLPQGAHLIFSFTDIPRYSAVSYSHMFCL